MRGARGLRVVVAGGRRRSGDSRGLGLRTGHHPRRARGCGRVEVEVTPTYSGCPATEVIAADIRAALVEGGFSEVTVRMVLSPPWTTDAISESGRAKLRAYGIAPPGPVSPDSLRPVRFARRKVACPQCGSEDTERISEFGSTACKALFRCRACREPFDYFKPL